MMMPVRTSRPAQGCDDEPPRRVEVRVGSLQPRADRNRAPRELHAPSFQGDAKSLSLVIEQPDTPVVDLAGDYVSVGGREGEARLQSRAAALRNDVETDAREQQ